MRRPDALLLLPVAPGGWVVSLVTLALPLAASAHGSDYIFARLDPTSGSEPARLELSLEFLENPYIQTREEARSILLNAFLLRGNRATRLLSEVVPPQWSERSGFDPSAPVPVPSEDPAAPHRLLVATWPALPLPAEGDAPPVLLAASGLKSAIVFWRSSADQSAPPDWRILIAGDEAGPLPASPPLPLQHRFARPGFVALAALVAATAALLAGDRLRRALRPATA